MSIKHLLAVAALAVSGQSIAAVSLVNGDFETPAVTNSDPLGYYRNLTGSQLTGWTVTSGSVDVVRQFGGNGWAPQSGSQSLDLNGFGPGEIFQSVSGFVVNQQYTLSYYYSGNGMAQSSLTFLGGTSQAGPIRDTVTGQPPAGWNLRSVTFTAYAPVVGLTFTSLTGAGPDGMKIDNINIAAVPEPHEWAMMLAGLGLVGWAARRRQAPAAMPV